VSIALLRRAEAFRPGNASNATSMLASQQLIAHQRELIASLQRDIKANPMLAFGQEVNQLLAKDPSVATSLPFLAFKQFVHVANIGARVFSSCFFLSLSVALFCVLDLFPVFFPLFCFY
jgi:hypothetical protein